MNKDDEKNNKTIRKEIVKDKKGSYVSEVQEFKKPADYEEAFKQYYPKRNV